MVLDNVANRVNMTLDEQKKVMLNILHVFHDFCMAHDLQYFLDAGTLLGAVRHKGFIPWDDDIDVCMLRSDMDAFLEMVKEDPYLLGENYIVELPQKTCHPFVKISDKRTVLVEYPEKYPMEVGVYIDIFTKDGILDDSKRTQMVCAISSNLGLLHWFFHFSVFAWRNEKNYIKRIIALIGRTFFGNSNWAINEQNRFIHEYARNHPLKKCKYVTTLTNGEFRNRARRELFDDWTLLDFEGFKFRAPVGYMDYLPCLYGEDFMTPPPKDKQRSHETCVYWRTEKDKEDFEKNGFDNYTGL